MLRGCGLLVFYGLLLALVELVDGGGRRYWSGREVSGQRVVFSDIDGTIVHYKGGSHGFANAGIEVVEEDTHKMRSVLKRPKGDTRECILVPSSTMGNGHISTRCVHHELSWRRKERGGLMLRRKSSKLFEYLLRIQPTRLLPGQHAARMRQVRASGACKCRRRHESDLLIGLYLSLIAGRSS